MSSPRPYLWLAIVLWSGSGVCGVLAVATALRRKRRRGQGRGEQAASAGGRAVLYLVSLSVMGAALGVGAFYASPGRLGSPTPELAEPQFEVSPAASPLIMVQAPPLTDSAEGGEATLTPSPARTRRTDGKTYRVGFDSVGDVQIGDDEDTIRNAFGTPTSVRPDDSFGKTLKAFVYEEDGLALTVYTLDGKVRYYSARSDNFVTHSGVAVGDSVDKVRQTYGSRLEEKGDGSLALAGQKGRVVVFWIRSGKVERIEGGERVS